MTTVLQTRYHRAPAPATPLRRRVEISVIIPVLNEAKVIGAALRQVPRTKGVEVIVVDGGSRDSTANIAEANGARLIHTAAGRARQMNAGAAIARGEILLFLHADTQLPPDFARLVCETLSCPGVVAGAFRLRINSPRPSLRAIEALANFRSNLMQAPYGDQALFLRADCFRAAGGFPEMPIMEDFEFMRRLRSRGRISIAPATALTSGRRWERLGVLRTTLVNQAIILAYLLGVAPERLARWYRGAAERSCSQRTQKRQWRHQTILFLWRAAVSFDRSFFGNHGRS